MKKSRLDEKVFLTGFMGAGKTTVGPVLARLLGVPFVDMDSMIRERQSCEIEDIMSLLGESGFRNLESEMLAEICSSPGAMVISTGGGVVIAEKNRRAMKESGITVYLKAKLETIMMRISKENERGISVRPLLKSDNPFERAAELFADRMEFYEKADLTVETDGRRPEDVAEKILFLLEPRLGKTEKKQ